MADSLGLMVEIGKDTTMTHLHSFPMKVNAYLLPVLAVLVLLGRCSLVLAIRRTQWHIQN